VHELPEVPPLASLLVVVLGLGSCLLRCLGMFLGCLGMSMSSLGMLFGSLHVLCNCFLMLLGHLGSVCMALLGTPTADRESDALDMALHVAKGLLCVGLDQCCLLLAG